MRTSKTARDTARIMGALSSRRSSTRIATAASVQSSPDTTPSGKRIKTEHGDVKTSGLKVEDTSPRKGITIKSEPTSATPSPTKVRQSVRKSGASIEDIEAALEDDDGLFPRPTRRLPAKRIKGENGEVTVSPPPNWELVYNMTAEMRKRRIAAVDTMGCENLADDTRSPLDRRLQTLVALMLSSQTKDPVTAAAIKNLQEGLPRGFNLEDLLEVEPTRLNELICKVGFHNNKTKYIKATAEILRDKWNGAIPDTIEGMVSLPGVGPKMAYLCMSSAWGRDEGIGVDVHVHRITNLWGWHKTSTPEQTRAELESWLPREKWHDINHLLVGFGQTYCPPVGRRCEGCDLAREGLCPSAVVPKELKKKVKREKAEDTVKEEEKEMVLVKANEDAPPLEMSAEGEVQGDLGVTQEVVVTAWCDM